MQAGRQTPPFFPMDTTECPRHRITFCLVSLSKNTRWRKSRKKSMNFNGICRFRVPMPQLLIKFKGRAFVEFACTPGAGMEARGPRTRHAHGDFMRYRLFQTLSTCRISGRCVCKLEYGRNSIVFPSLL